MTASKARPIDPTFATTFDTDQLRLVMEEVIRECEEPGDGAGSIANDALKLKLAAELVRCAEAGERDLDRLKQMAIEAVLRRAGEDASPRLGSY